MPNPEGYHTFEQSPQNGYYDPPIRYIMVPKTYVHESEAIPLDTSFQGPIDIDTSRGELSGMPFDAETNMLYHTLGIGEYPDPGVIQETEKAFEKKYNLKYGKVLLQGGQASDGVLQNIIQGFITDTTPVLAAGPHFPRIAYTAMQRGDESLYLSVQPRSHTIDEGVALMLEDPEVLAGDRMLLYVSNPNSPLGDTVHIEKLDALAKLAEEKNHILLVDEAFGDVLEPEESAITLTDKYASVIVTKSFSKFFGLPGLGAGAAIMSPNLAQEYEKQLAPYRIRGAELHITRNIATADLSEFTALKKAQIRERKTQLLDALEAAGIAYLPTDQRTPILTIIASDENQQDQLARLFRIKVAGAEAFEDTHAQMNKRFFRVTVRDSLLQHQQIVYALSVLRDRNSGS